MGKVDQKNFKMLAKCFYGFEKILSEELLGLGAQKIKIGRRNVSFYGDKGFMYKANLSLRTALKILKPISEFHFSDINSFYNKIYKIRWESLLGVDSTFIINSSVFHSKIFNNSKFTSLKAKDAIVDRFRNKFSKRPNIDAKNPDLKIDIHINKSICTVSIDSSGESLHKRGYKKYNSFAPLNEVLAAGLILLSGWRGKIDFLDPMCGCGTILIEAAMIAGNIPPNLHRSSFAFEKWNDWDQELFNIIEESLTKKINKINCKIFGYDISNVMIRKCKKNIEESDIDFKINVETRDFFKSKKHNKERLLIIVNPPYDKRIQTDFKSFYSDIGNNLKRNYDNTSSWIFTANMDAIKCIGLRTSKRIKLFNSSLESRFLNYQIYSGSKKEK
jgi:putative N6-adenine-specific DNA methylase